MSTATSTRVSRPTSVLPGLAEVAVVVVGAYLLWQAVSSVSPPVWAFGLGVLLGPLARGARGAAGRRFASRTLLRAGVALLGLEIALSDLLAIGPSGFAIAVGVIAATMLGTIAFARRLGVTSDLALLIGAGSAICGASAVAAIETVTRARESDSAYAIGTVTVFGTIAMISTPLIAEHLLHLDTRSTGLWIGASVHEVAQVAGSGALVSADALQIAVIIKLTRVVLLGPLVAIVASNRSGGLRVPGFVIAFLALVGARTILDIPAPALDVAHATAVGLLAAGLGALALQVDARSLVRAGPRPLVLGLGAWLIASATALSLVFVLG